MNQNEDSMLWMLDHHLQAMITLIFINREHEILDPKVVNYYMLQKAQNSEEVWEEEIWKKIADTFLLEKKSATLHTIK